MLKKSAKQKATQKASQQAGNAMKSKESADRLVKSSKSDTGPGAAERTKAKLATQKLAASKVAKKKISTRGK